MAEFQKRMNCTEKRQHQIISIAGPKESGQVRVRVRPDRRDPGRERTRRDAIAPDPRSNRNLLVQFCLQHDLEISDSFSNQPPDKQVSHFTRVSKQATVFTASARRQDVEAIQVAHSETRENNTETMVNKMGFVHITSQKPLKHWEYTNFSYCITRSA